MSDHYCCKKCGSRDNCRCGPAVSTTLHYASPSGAVSYSLFDRVPEAPSRVDLPLPVPSLEGLEVTELPLKEAWPLLLEHFGQDDPPTQTGDLRL